MIDSRIEDEAALWMARARDPNFDDWDALTDWLRADPAHNLAYEVAYAAHDLTGRSETPSASTIAAQPSRRHRYMAWFVSGGVGVAAAAAAALLFLLMPTAGPALIVTETRPGEQRMIALADGTHIALNGGSRLIFDAKNGRTAKLEKGEAMFSIVHDDSRPFTVDVGDQRLVDLGTRFDVVRNQHGSEIAVAQGMVLYDPQGAAVRLGPGRMLRKRDRSNLVEVMDVDPDGIGTWRGGRLIYHGAFLSRVAEDISRLSGERVEMAPDLAQRTFTGVIVVPPKDRRRFINRLGLMLDVDVASRPQGYYLKARATH